MQGLVAGEHQHPLARRSRSSAKPHTRDEGVQAVMHQAAGVLHTWCGWDVDDTVALIRPYAYAEEQPVAGAAGEVVRGSRLLP